MHGRAVSGPIGTRTSKTTLMLYGGGRAGVMTKLGMCLEKGRESRELG